MKLGIFEAFGNGPRTSSVLAEELGLDPSLTYRLMRALGALDLLAENTEQTFSLTETGERLRSDHPQTLRGVTLLEEGPEHYALWTHLPEMIRDGKQNAFIREFGRMAFDHAAHDPHYAEVFDGAMSSYSGTQASCVLDALHTYDFSKMTHVCDVGGGHGFMVCQFLNQYPISGERCWNGRKSSRIVPGCGQNRWGWAVGVNTWPEICSTPSRVLTLTS